MLLPFNLEFMGYNLGKAFPLTSMEAVIKQSEWKDLRRLSGLVQHLERFEAKVNVAAKNEVEYYQWLSEKVKAISSQLKTAESRPRLSNSTGSGEIISTQEAGKSANVEWKEQVYQKVQRMNSTYFPKLNAVYQQMNRKLQQLESSPQEPNTVILEKYRRNTKMLEKILALLGVSKSQITTEFKEKLDKAEKFIQYNFSPKNVSSHHQGQQHSADVQSRQQSRPSHSSISQMEILETKPSPQALGTQNCHATEDVSQQNKMCLQEQQVAKRYSNSQQDVNQLSIIKGPGNAVQQQTQGAQKATEAFSVSVNTQGISASPLIENCNNLKEFSRKPTLTSDEPSAAMQRFLKVLTSISPEALSASIGDIREVVYLNDVIPTSELINGPQKMVQQQKQPSLIPQTGTNLASDIHPCSQARNVTCNDFVSTGRKRSHSMNAMTVFDTSRICASSWDSFNQLIDAERPDLTSVASKIKQPRIMENCSLLEEIKEINNLLIDSEIVIGEKDSIQSAAGGAAEHGEGLVIKFLFSAVTVNQNLISHLSADKKSIIKPLWLFVPTSYPFSSPVILDKMLLEVSEGLKDLSAITKSKLRFSLQCLNQPWSLGDIAMSWERCAREAILEYAQGIGGGTFSSRYGGWDMCQNF
ncbi:Mediator of RNA polymerase II transcription subunit 15a [Spatholobus suberectus]|nr:Mediator of RNA polymerase II transcription subunit 15a [Spatholobus suberectus]